MQPKHKTVLIGVINPQNLGQIDDLHPNPKTILFSNINLANLKEILEPILSKGIILIPSNQNLIDAKKHRRMPAYTLFVDLLMKQPIEVRLLMNNDSLFYINAGISFSHERYDGASGFAIGIGSHSGTIFYGHSATISDSSEKLLQKSFNGSFLNDI